MAEHTPTPWKMGDRKPYVEIWGPMRMNSSPILASMEHEPRDANAAFIVKAVNNHEPMVAELQRLFELYGHQATADVLADVLGPVSRSGTADGN